MLPDRAARGDGFRADRLFAPPSAASSESSPTANTGYLVPAGDPQQLADRLVRLLSNPQAARRMGQAGRRAASRPIRPWTAASMQRSRRSKALSEADYETSGRVQQMKRHILILVENLSVPFDRRVWQESRALVDAGYTVTVICPTGDKQDTEREVEIDGVRILRYPLRAATGGPLGYLREYGARAVAHAAAGAQGAPRGRVDVVHACNPPDLLFLIAVALRPGGTPLRLRPSRPRAGAVPVPLPEAAVECSTGSPDVRRAADLRRCRRGDLDERELPARRDRARQDGGRPGDRWCAARRT